MPDLNVPTLFAWLALVFLLLGLGRCVATRRWHPQARAWLILGLIFSAVAWWLRLPHP